MYVGILRNIDINKLQLASQDSSELKIYAAGIEVYTIPANKKLDVKNSSDYLKAYYNDSISASSFIVKTAIEGSRMKIIIAEQEYFYKGDLLVEHDTGGLILTNIIDINDYLESVMVAEIAGLRGNEFLKAMAVVSRTYAIKNTFKHIKDHYDLCDQVHCQVYHGIENVPNDIIEAIRMTGKEIIIDETGSIIDAVFFANSGGLTANVEDVWQVKAPYLRSVEDSFSITGDGYTWVYKIATKDWQTYLSQKINDTVSDFYCEVEYARKKKYYCNDVPIPLTDIRKDLGLRSTLFLMEENVYPDISGPDTLYLYGRGYGHGVGFSQEGAYEMGKRGFKYYEIIAFYYQRVEIIDYNLWRREDVIR